jgi:sec-independent protein translocase protein TatA
MPNLRGSEWLIILLLVVLLFGAKRLPDAARSIGRSLRIFKAETKGLVEGETAPSTGAATTAATTPEAPATSPALPPAQPAAPPVVPPTAAATPEPAGPALQAPADTTPSALQPQPPTQA